MDVFKTGLYKPKAAGSSPLSDVTLVMVVWEGAGGAGVVERDVGSASALAKRIGLKDMRAAGTDVVEATLGVRKDEGGCDMIVCQKR